MRGSFSRADARSAGPGRLVDGTVDAAWRFPDRAAVSSLVTRRADVRHASVAALGFGLIGALVAVVAGSASPGPFLLATTTTLLGSLVAALALFGILAVGFLDLARRTAGSRLAGGQGVARRSRRGRDPGRLCRRLSRPSPRALTLPPPGVVAVLVVMGTAVATIAGSLVPWRGDGIGDQLSSVAAFMAVALATSFAIGLVAPRLTTLGLPDPGVAIVLCGVFSLGAIAILARRLRGGER